VGILSLQKNTPDYAMMSLIPAGALVLLVHFGGTTLSTIKDLSTNMSTKELFDYFL
jgi:hypothetical protein